MAKLDIKKQYYNFTDKRVLCPNIHKGIEKNWAPFTRGDKLYFQYGLTTYSIYKYNASKNKCEHIKTKNSNIFEKMSETYSFAENKKNYFESAFVFSCTTPLIPFDKDLIGVAHVKLYLKDMWNLLKDNPHLKSYPAWKYIRKVQKKYKLPANYSTWDKDPKGKHIVQPTNNILYLWFFYTIDGKTFNLKKFSKFFTPQSTNTFPNMVTFPMALQPFMNDQYIIPYGVSDIAINAMIISKNDIKKQLKYTNDTDFDKIPFSLN